MHPLYVRFDFQIRLPCSSVYLLCKLSILICILLRKLSILICILLCKLSILICILLCKLSILICILLCKLSILTVPFMRKDYLHLIGEGLSSRRSSSLSRGSRVPTTAAPSPRYFIVVKAPPLSTTPVPSLMLGGGGGECLIPPGY